MSLSSPPPWESFGFPDILNFGVQGAKLGLERAGQTLGADDASNRLALSYAQLASENQRAAAAQAGEAQRAASMDALARIKEANDQENAMQLSGYRGAETASRTFRDALALNNAQRAARARQAPVVKYANVNGHLIPYLVDQETGRGSWAPSGALTTDKVGQLTPVDRERIRQLRSGIADLTKKWAGGGLAAEKAARDPNSPEGKEFQADKAKIQSLNDQINALLPAGPTGGPGSAFSAPPEFPLQMPTSIRQGLPTTDLNDPLGILSGNVNAISIPDEQ